MTARWRDFSEPEREAARRYFTALEQSASIASAIDRSDTDRGLSSTAISMSELWTAIVSRRPLPGSVGALGVPLEDLAAILDRASVAAIPRQAAAASEAVTSVSRVGRRVRLFLSPTRGDEPQSYATLELADREMVPVRLIALRPDGATAELVLPTPVDGAVQLLLKNDDPVTVFLRDPDCRIYLV